MRKLAIMSIILLLLSSIVPYETFAKVGEDDVNSKDIATQEFKNNDAKDQGSKNAPVDTSKKQENEFEETEVEKDISDGEWGKNQGNKEKPNAKAEENVIDDNATKQEQEAPPVEDDDNANQDKEEEILEKDEDLPQAEETVKEPIVDDQEDQTKVMKRSLSIKESKTSKLGHIRSSNVDIYKDINNLSSSIKAGNTYTDKVYYIKKQANVVGQIYYLVSTEPSSVKGVVGWIKASDLSIHSHVGVDKSAKNFYIKGNGSSYGKAWGGSKDLIYNLAQYKDQAFKVHLTEKVGSNTWYRGQLNGKTVWIHSSYLTLKEGSKTSRLGHMRSTNVKIYKNIDNLSSSITAGEKYTNSVYYIKRQAQIGNQLYYLISNEPSSTKGVVGWVRSQDLSTHSHVGMDKKAKTFYLKGTGKAYSKAWGGNKDLIYDLSKYKDQTFKVNLTEKVGSNTWYRGVMNGKTVWMHSSYVTAKEERKTSKLGHIRRTNVKIFKSIDNLSSSFTAGNKYTDSVYYIKKQAKIGDQLYYLISNEPSSTKGVVGWVKSQDLSTHPHLGLDKKAKTFYVEGSGIAYNKAWGGSKNFVYDLSEFKSQAFKVNLTEKVGNNTWYRGVLNGKTVWMYSSYVTTKKESNTSRLGHIRSGARIYKNIGDESSSFSSSKYLNAVYYIKKQAEVNGEIFYLISTQPSSTKGIVGWVKAADLSSHTHVGVDKKAKTFFVKGSGSAYSKAWGGTKDEIYPSLSQYENEEFKINLTERVGNNLWYRGTLNGKTTWIHEAYLNKSNEKRSKYNLTLSEALKIQMNASPQTDKSYSTYVSKTYIDKKGKVTASALNVRGGAATNYWVVGQLKKGDKVTILKEVNGWYQIEYTKKHQWANPNENDVLYYLNPANFVNDEKQKFQFLDLSKSSGAPESVLNNYLSGKETLAGQGKAFIEASRIHGINDIYLVSHAILETGNGSSTLAKGIKYNGKTVYNMFGVGAYDSCPIDCGAKKAYEEGWTTPYKAIVGGAKFIDNGYISAGQNTLYKMRWNPDAMVFGKAAHQYATDIGWASKQIHTMYNLYQQLDSFTLFLDIPDYK